MVCVVEKEWNFLNKILKFCIQYGTFRNNNNVKSIDFDDDHDLQSIDFQQFNQSTAESINTVERLNHRQLLNERKCQQDYKSTSNQRQIVLFE